jgi:hypothetical protein
MRHFLTLTAISISAAILGAPAMAQQWNEIPPPTGKEAVARAHPATFRTDIFDVRVPPNGGEVEYMINMKLGEAVVYSWEVQSIANPNQFHTEFHGHTEPVNGRGDLMFYEKGEGAKANGSLVAPWVGTHGWYCQNNSACPSCRLVVRF